MYDQRVKITNIKNMRSRLEIKVYMTKYYKIKIEQNKHKSKTCIK